MICWFCDMIRIEGAVIIVVEVIIKNDDLKLILVLSFQRLCISPVLVYFSDGEPGTSVHSLHQGVGTVLHNHSILQPGNKRNATLKNNLQICPQLAEISTLDFCFGKKYKNIPMGLKMDDT